MGALVRRSRDDRPQTLNALLKRLDKALAGFYPDNSFTDEINGP
jgi:hypothetical protein